MKIILKDTEPALHPSPEDMAAVILDRMGLEPRKKGATDKFHRVLAELYEKSKEAARNKNPESAILTVEEMAMHAGITRQTMYEYLKRWLDLTFIVKTSYIKDGKVIIGYKLNGNTLESAFEKSVQKINNNLETTAKYVLEYQRILKNDKIKQTLTSKQSKIVPREVPEETQSIPEEEENEPTQEDRPLE